MNYLRLRFTNPPIGEALAGNAFEGCFSAVRIGNAKLFAVVVTKVEFSQVARANALRRRGDRLRSNAALEDREEVLRRCSCARIRRDARIPSARVV